MGHKVGEAKGKPEVIDLKAGIWGGEVEGNDKGCRLLQT
jgi:hypothetical protein